VINNDLESAMFLVENPFCAASAEITALVVIVL
jgi:hypothetical protein